MSAPPLRRDWDASLSQITAPQWMQAIAWRAAMRVLPLLLDLPRTLPLAHAVMRLLYATIFRLDSDYRRRLGDTPSEATVQAARAVDAQVERVRQLYGPSEESHGAAELVESTFMPLASSTTEAPALARERISQLHRALSQIPAPVPEAWEGELVADLEALEPLNQEDLDDLQTFLVRPLWGKSATERSDFAKYAREWLGRMHETGPVEATFSPRLLDHYERHLASTLDWAGVRTLILEKKRRKITPEEAVALRALANDPVRVATLLAKAALEDRARLKLTVEPSTMLFREAFPAFAPDPVALLELDRVLEKSYPDFTPNPLWLAWIQTARRLGLEAIQAEIRLRLSESEAETPKARTSLTTRPTRREPAKPDSKAADERGVRKAK